MFFEFRQKIKFIKEMQTLCSILNCDIDNLLTTEKLPIQTFIMAKSSFTKQKYTYLYSNDISIIDTVIFSYAFLKPILFYINKDEELIEYVCRKYKRSLVMFMSYYFDYTKNEIMNIFENRISLYNDILRVCDQDNITKALIQEFKICLLNDFIYSEYKPISVNSPLPLIGFDQDMHCNNEASSYANGLYQSMEDILKDIARMTND